MKQIRECPRSEIIEYIRTQLEQGRIFDASSNLPFDFSIRNVSFYSSVENETVQVLREFSKKYGSVEVSDDLISGVYQLIQDSREQALAERHTSLKSAERRLEDIYHTSEEFGKRKGSLLSMKPDRNEMFNLVYKISSQNMIGLQNILMTATKGTITLNSYLIGYEKRGETLPQLRSGALVSYESGETIIYGLVNAQDRGTLFVGAGEQVYSGMVVGINPRPDDIEINVCKEKKLTNNRSKGEGVKRILSPATSLSLEQALDFIVDDELLEVTPKNVRIRKRILDHVMRKRSHYNS